jgi:trk system potassium uptake protein
MQVVIMGCGRTGSALATRCDAEGDQVTVIDPDDDAEGRLAAGFHGRFLAGSGVTPAVLEAAGIKHAEALVALTPNDSANIVAARVARETFRVPRVIARLHDPAHAPLYSELGITTVGSVQTTVNRIVQLLHHRTHEPHQTFGNGETLLVRSVIPGYLAGPSGQDSHMLKAMTDANALALLPDGNGVRAGDEVEILLLDTDLTS